jgi:hypothetical protein
VSTTPANQESVERVVDLVANDPNAARALTAIESALLAQIAAGNPASPGRRIEISPSLLARFTTLTDQDIIDTVASWPSGVLGRLNARLGDSTIFVEVGVHYAECITDRQVKSENDFIMLHLGGILQTLWVCVAPVDLSQRQAELYCALRTAGSIDATSAAVAASTLV